MRRLYPPRPSDSCGPVQPGPTDLLNQRRLARIGNHANSTGHGEQSLVRATRSHRKPHRLAALWAPGHIRGSVDRAKHPLISPRARVPHLDPRPPRPRVHRPLRARQSPTLNDVQSGPWLTDAVPHASVHRPQRPRDRNQGKLLPYIRIIGFRSPPPNGFLKRASS